MPMIFDAHLDLAYNALGYDRDQTAELSAIRQREQVLTDQPQADRGASQMHRGVATVTLPQMRRARVGACLATLLARCPGQRPLTGEPLRRGIDYGHPSIAEAAARSQFDYYLRLERMGWIRLVTTGPQLREAWQERCADPDAAPLPTLLTMEGCDPIFEPADASQWSHLGLRSACLGHYGQGRYTYATGGDGPLTDLGRQLVRAFGKLGILIDLVHTADQAFEQILQLYDGPVYISHGNCRALVRHDRQISDDQIRAVAQRDGVIGVVCDRWMLDPHYDPANPRARAVPISTLADHIDHTCQLTGSDRHAGIGSDLDGGFGVEQCPDGLDSIADLQQLADILAGRGYKPDAIDRIFHGNWLRFFSTYLPGA